ncbi:2TM domain-containing protein [Cryobacterium shii]|uniref:2TM domain-containing protein n=1 Tax=Cryobacterium shii TaxID=1259235 RepID=A0AAQ2C4I1_9MICO|nr:2TM domain-containing protein [Cryobacterium shii]TFC43351.1 2TM domain-containing protein [Cryobacterium shii]
MAEKPDESGGQFSPDYYGRAVTDRDLARRRLERKRKLTGDLVAYVVVNAFLVGVWFFVGGGYFWPGWVLAGWGVALLLDAWNTLYRRPITEADIDREMRSGS